MINNSDIIGKVHNSMYQQIKKSGVATPVQVLMDLDVLTVTDYKLWRLGAVDYLERVCNINLHKLSFIMKHVRAYAGKNDLKPSFTFYKQWGRRVKSPAKKLRFSKTGDDTIERSYATHYISGILKEEKKQSVATDEE